MIGARNAEIFHIHASVFAKWIFRLRKPLLGQPMPFFDLHNIGGNRYVCSL